MGFVHRAMAGCANVTAMDSHFRYGSLTYSIIGAAMEVHRELGPGLLESCYKACLVRELEMRGHRVATEEQFSLEYKGLMIEKAYRTDIAVDATVIVEIECVDALVRVHEAQLLTYMKLRKLPVGLLFNFHAASIRGDFRRFVL